MTGLCCPLDVLGCTERYTDAHNEFLKKFSAKVCRVFFSRFPPKPRFPFL